MVYSMASLTLCVSKLVSILVELKVWVFLCSPASQEHLTAINSGVEIIAVPHSGTMRAPKTLEKPHCPANFNTCIRPGSNNDSKCA